jgi:uncharacterized protein
MVDWLVPFLPLLKLFLVFILLVLLLLRKVSIGTSILLGSVALGLLFRLEPREWIRSALSGLTDPKLLYLACIVALILVLSDVMEKTGQSSRLMNGLSRFLLWRRLKLSFFPALIGLLPMPGGALFSAPMVGTAADGLPISGEQKVMINYWFRHIWELIWPLYPGIILASSMAGVPLVSLLALTWPSLLITLALGWWFFLRPAVLKLPPPRESTDEMPRPAAVLLVSMPLVLALAGSLLFEGLITLSGVGVPYEWGLLLGLGLGIAESGRCNRLGPVALFRLVSKRHLSRMLYLVLCIFVFKGILENGGVVGELGTVMRGESALMFVALVLPMLVGLISGISMAFVGSTFPLIMALMAQSPETSGDLTYIVLALFAGFTGVLASPVHVCLVLTCEYFHVPLSRIWRLLLPPCALFLLLGSAYILVLRSMLLP